VQSSRHYVNQQYFRFVCDSEDAWRCCIHVMCVVYICFIYSSRFILCVFLFVNFSNLFVVFMDQLLLMEFLLFFVSFFPLFRRPSLILTPVAGPTFETKNRAIFSGEFFSGEEFLEQHYCPRTLFPSMSVEWIHFPRIRTFVPKRFHGLFSKKKRSKSGVLLRFQKENTFGQ